MRRPPIFVCFLLAWVLAEAIAFWIVVNFIGWTGAIFISIASCLAGANILRQLGKGAARSMRQAIEGAPVTNGKVFDGLLTAIGAILLILPGFCSDIVGLGLAAPSLRQWIARRMGSARSRPRARLGDVLELSPEEWAPLDPTGPFPGSRS